MGMTLAPGSTISMPGTFTVYAYDGSAGCSDEESFTVTVDPIPSVNNPGNQQFCAGDLISIPLSGTAGATFNWTNDIPSIGLAASGNGDINFTAASTGGPVIANITVTPNLNGCTGTSISFQIRIDPVPSVNQVSDLVVCAGDPVSVFFGSTIFGATFSGTNSNTAIGAPATGSANSLNFTAANVSSTQVGIISVVATANGCPGPPMTFTITVNPRPSINPISDVTICNAYTLPTITGTALSGSQAYYTAPGGGGTQLLPGDVVNNTITLYAYDGVPGCDDEVSFTITIGTSGPSVTANITNVQCPGEANGAIDLMVSGDGPFFYDWENGSFFEGRTDLSPGTYTVTVTDANACQTIESFTVVEPAPISLLSCGAFQNETTTGAADGRASVTISGGTPPYIITYQDESSNSATASGMGPEVFIEGLSAGTYLITSIRDANSCLIPAICSFTIDTDSQTCLSVSDIELGPTRCAGDSSGTITITLANVVGPLDIQWDEPSFGNTLAVTNAFAGTFSVTITDTGNPTCPPIQESITVSDASPIVVSCTVLQDASGQANSDGQASIDLSGGNGPYDVLISGNSNSALTGVSGLQTINGLLPGDYTVMVQDANGCEATCMFTVNIQPGGCNLMIRDSVVGISCAGANDGQFIVIISDTIGPVTIEWSIPGFDNQPIALVGAGTYGVTVTDLGANTVCWRALDGAVFTEPSDTLALLCGELSAASGAGIPDGIATFVMNGGRGDYSLTLTGPTDTLINGVSGAFLDVANLLPGDYQAVLRDAFNCEATCDFTITAAGCALQIIDANQENISCAGADDGSITLAHAGAVGMVGAVWDDGFAEISRMNLVAGTYAVTLTDEAGCIAAQSFTITQPDSLLIACSMPTETSTPLATDASGGVAVSGGTAPYEVVLTQGAASDTSTLAVAGIVDFNNLGVGTYLVQIIDANGCVESCSFTVTPAGCPLQVSFTLTPVSCNGASDATITLSITGNNGAVSVDWNIDQYDGEQDILVPPGTYSATVTDAAGCVFSTGDIVVIDPEPLALACQVLSDVTHPNAANGRTEAVISGGTAPYQLITQRFLTPTVSENDTLLLMNNDTLVVDSLDGLSNPARDYRFIVIDANGCRDTCSFQIFEPPCPDIFLSDSIHPVACFGDSSGRIAITVNNGTAPYTYDWGDPTLADTNVLENLAAGLYTLVVSDSNQCTAAQQFEVLQPLAPLSIFCEQLSDVSIPGGMDGSASVAASGGTPPYRIILTQGGLADTLTIGASDTTFSNLSAASYSTQILDANGCLSEVCSFLINEGSCTLSLSATSLAADCRGPGQIDLSVSGNTGLLTYTWSVDSLNGIEDPIVAAGTYSVTVTEANGCSDSLDISVAQIDNQPSLVISDGGAVCVGEEISLTLSFSGSAPFTADIRTTPGGLLQFTGLSNDTTLFFATDTITGGLLEINLIAFADSQSCGAVLDDQRSILISYPDTIVRNEQLCTSDTITIGGRFFSAAAPSDTFLLAGNACGVLYQIDLDFSALASIDTSDIRLCEGDSILVFGQTFSAANPQGLVPTGLSNAAGCDSSIFVRLDFYPTVIDTMLMTICAEDSLTINGTTLTPSNPEALINTGQTNANGCDSLVYVILDFYPVNIGMASFSACRGETLSLFGRDFTFDDPSGIIVFPGAASTGCDSLLAVSVNFQNSPQVSLRGDNSICLGDSSDLVFEVSGSGSVDIVLTDGLGGSFTLTGVGNNDRFAFSPSMSATYTITAAVSGNPCPVQFSGAARVEVARLLASLESEIDQNGYQISCNGAADGGLRLEVAEGLAPYTISWNTGVQTERISNLAPGSYTVSLTDAANCSVQLSALIQEPPPIVARVSATAPPCNADLGSIRIDSVLGGQGPYEWSLDGTFFQQITSFPASQTAVAATYRVMIQDVLDCSREVEVSVPMGQDPVLLMPEDASIQLGDSIFLLAQTDFIPDSILWQPGSTVSTPNSLGTFVRPLESTLYRLVLSDSSGCSVSGQVLVQVDRRVPIYAPNIFSPNADGANDRFRLFAGPGVERIELLQIFDRWGEQVYATTDYDPNNPAIGWDGIHRGQPLNPAVFIYYYRARLADGRVVDGRGDVVLRR